MDLLSQPEPLYRIMWRTKSGEYEGSGAPYDKGYAQSVADRLNMTFPDTAHWIEPTISHLEQLLRSES